MEFVNKYFWAERMESLLFMVVGGIAVTLACKGWLGEYNDLFRGMAWPFLIVGMIQLIVGATVYFRSPADARRVNEMLEDDPFRLRKEEIPRMEQVMRNFRLYRWTEFGLALLGCCLLLFSSSIGFWKGVGTGLFVQAGVMLMLDFFAERRGKAYLQKLWEVV